MIRTIAAVVALLALAGAAHAATDYEAKGAKEQCDQLAKQYSAAKNLAGACYTCWSAKRDWGCQSAMKLSKAGGEPFISGALKVIQAGKLRGADVVDFCGMPAPTLKSMNACVSCLSTAKNNPWYCKNCLDAAKGSDAKADLCFEAFRTGTDGWLAGECTKKSSIDAVKKCLTCVRGSNPYSCI